jgi:S-formylglutathione hydrolase
MNLVKSHKSFEGKTQFWSHDSKSTGTAMKFSTFIPDGGASGCIIWLSGLTCTEENFITKAGAQKYLADHKLMVICPDTSPRGLDLPNEHQSYDFGSGAGFYLNATVEPYSKHYRMYDYITEELDSLIRNDFGIKNVSIMGHSMGGHGALIIGLRNLEKYKSISAFSPIVNPVMAPWGIKAFTGYLGEDKALWAEYDAVELLKNGKKHSSTVLIHQGTQDEFLARELLTNHFETAAKEAGQEQKVVFAEGYDHSYYFIASFIQEHVIHHSKYLKS